MSQQKLDPVKIEKLRKKRKRKRFTVFLLFILIIGAFLAYVTGIYDAMVSVTRDVVDTVITQINKGEGFPLQFTMPGLKTASEFVGGVAAIGETDFVIISPSGKELRRLQHGYARAAISTQGTRVALYNLAGTELKIEGRSGTFFKKIFAQPIQAVSMSKSGSFAVVTRSARYEAELTVFNSLFKEEYYWYSASDTPISIATSDSGKQVAVLCVSANEGALGGKIYMLDLSLDEALAEINVAEALPIKANYFSNGDLCVVYDTFAAIYSAKTGEEIGRYSYSGQILQMADISEKYIALTFKASAYSSASTLMLVDAKMQQMAQINLPAGADDICLTRTNAFVATSKKVETYGLDGVLWGEEILSSPCEYIINAKELLAVTRTQILACNPTTKAPDKVKN